MSEKRLQWILFGLVSFVVWLVYFYTQAPTVVFWDVGEFLATSVILGVPHPPGTPLYVILGKFMTLLPLPLDVLYSLVRDGSPQNVVLKITLISVTTGALTAGFVYLLTVKTLHLWNRDLPRSLVHLSGIFGALIGAFAQTVWFNSTEAETYTPANFIILFTAWVAFKWWEEKDDPRSLGYLIFIGYVTLLWSGIHLGALIGLPAIIFFVYLVKREILWDIKLVPLIVVLGLLYAALKLSYEPTLQTSVANLVFQGILLFYLYYRQRLDFNSLWVIALVVALVASAGGIMMGNLGLQIAGALLATVAIYVRDQLYKDWRGFTLLLMLLGFSTELFLILRAKWGALHPDLLRINEAEPDDWKAFLDVLTRKQYEPAKILPRRIAFIDQLKVFWLYYSWQYGSLLIPVTFLALVGVLTHFANERKSFALLFGLLLLGTLGLIIYLNLKDSPTMPVNPLNKARGITEVRDRDYFFALGFTMIGLYAGMGLYEILRLIKVNLKIPKLAHVVGILLAAGIVGWQFAWAYPYRDRSKNYIAEDYAYNMLQSPRKGKAVMFTNGDNDTFPLWFVQEVLGIRRDVIIANLSLLNTDWYCRQLKGWGAPISFSDEDLKHLQPVYQVNGRFVLLKDIMIRDMIATSAGYRPDPEDYVNVGGVRMPKIYFAPRDQFLKEVIEGAQFQVPIYFALTVSRDNYLGWHRYLLMEGLAFRVVGEPVGTEQIEGVNAEYTRYKLHDHLPPDEFLAQYADRVYPEEGVFRYRGVFNPKVYKDETHEKLIRNYASVALRLGLHYESLGETQKAAEELDLAGRFLRQVRVSQSPELLRQVMAIELRAAVLYREAGDYSHSLSLLARVDSLGKDPTVYYEMAQTYAAQGDTTQALQYLELAASMSPRQREVYTSLAQWYEAQGNLEAARRALDKALRLTPGDSQLMAWANRLDSLLKEAKSTKGE